VFYSFFYFFLCSPISLAEIKGKLNSSNPLYYQEIHPFISDVKRMFSNAFLFYQVSYYDLYIIAYIFWRSLSDSPIASLKCSPPSFFMALEVLKC
jgi:hypothetical protein